MAFRFVLPLWVWHFDNQIKVPWNCQTQYLRFSWHRVAAVHRVVSVHRIVSVHRVAAI